MTDKIPTPEREQTDESLRIERENADRALEDVAAVDETADAVIARARARADQLLAAARARIDRQAASAGPGAEPPRILQRERLVEDRLLRDERAIADETLREERAEHVALLSHEREETDKDLSNERARADAAVTTRDDLLGIVSHDLRNMLTAMIGFAALIVNAPPAADDDSPVRVYARRIQRSGARMDRLVGDLVDLASIEAGVLAVTREQADPAQVAAEAVEAFQAQAAAGGLSLELEVVPPMLAVFDPARILQVLTNLLSNAIKFTPNGGSIVVRVERAGEEIRFSVTDTGIGIPADSLEAVFGQYRQVSSHDRRGTGLGLYISKSIVQGHGGHIWAESRILKSGSAICFTLPIGPVS